ncbi:MAG TPA: hypothetical protein VFQ43_10970, partial [Nitrososphaera sp.]|nr:hypothetical protein [Nitrososphaera sp.]
MTDPPPYPVIMYLIVGEVSKIWPLVNMKIIGLSIRHRGAVVSSLCLRAFGVGAPNLVFNALYWKPFSHLFTDEWCFRAWVSGERLPPEHAFDEDRAREDSNFKPSNSY